MTSNPPGRGRAVAPSPPAARRAADAYHHGALRQALLDAAQSILEEQGLEGFTLRECARRAGVSHAAPAHHFGDAAGLLTAFATLGFERLAELMRQHRGRAAGTGEAQLRAVGLAYVDFAIRHRAHFQLMFRHDRLDASDPDLAAAGARASGHLAETLQAALAARGVDCEDSEFDDRMMLAWSGVHGFATLLLEGRLDGWRGRQSPGRFALAAGDRLLALLETALLRPDGAAAMPAQPGGGPSRAGLHESQPAGTRARRRP
ncbi:hypothetical protein GCM10023144_39160 [Pigmentiphaga soli]|uniref:HTH tetR-type domain-containing protein n=1 Tax=Pigmentiphaga soli TaxID=1007095 RepID=A0ABP8HJ51_9BURK